MYKKILVPHEQLKDASHALERAAGLAKSLDADLLVLGILVPPPKAILFSHDDPLEGRTADKTFVELHQQAQAWSEQQGLRVRIETQIGHAVPTIVQIAREQNVDLIVLGDTGYPGNWGPLLENSAEMVSLHAGCDILLVR